MWSLMRLLGKIFVAFFAWPTWMNGWFLHHKDVNWFQRLGPFVPAIVQLLEAFMAFMLAVAIWRWSTEPIEYFFVALKMYAALTTIVVIGRAVRTVWLRRRKSNVTP